MKIAICTPCHSDVTAAYAKCLAKLVAYTLGARIVFNGHPVSPSFEIFMRTGSLLPRLRNRLAADALDWGANYLLWIDADHWFPEHALMRLLSLNLPVVGVNYPRRAEPFLPTATGVDGHNVWTTEALAKSGEVAEVRHLGLGFCLIDINVIQAIAGPPAGEAAPLLFATELRPDGVTIAGEDVYFFERIRKAGYKVHLDHQLSWDIGHITTRVLTNADAERSGAARQTSAT